MNEAALRALIEQWQALADQAREQTRLAHVSDLTHVTFYQGVMQTYVSAAQDLRDLLDPPQAAKSAEPASAYQIVPEAEAAAVVQRAGLFARSITLHPDRVFTAVFSRLQPITQESRVRQLSAADARVVVVDQGTLRDTGDPYIDFAFV